MSVIGEDWKIRERIMRCWALQQNGSIQLPRELTEFMGWREGDILLAELSRNEIGIALYRARGVCSHCGVDRELNPVYASDGAWTGTMICTSCLEGTVENAYKPVDIDTIFGPSMGTNTTPDTAGKEQSIDIEEPVFDQAKLPDHH